MTNPFEDPDARYLVLVNTEQQYSLWPALVEIPAGWDSAYSEASRQECIDFIARTWTDMRPKSLANAMKSD